MSARHRSDRIGEERSRPAEKAGLASALMRLRIGFETAWESLWSAAVRPPQRVSVPHRAQFPDIASVRRELLGIAALEECDAPPPLPAQQPAAPTLPFQPGPARRRYEGSRYVGH